MRRAGSRAYQRGRTRAFGAEAPQPRDGTGPVRDTELPERVLEVLWTVRWLTAADVRIGWREPNERAAI